jgi:hypothetical protein
MREAFCVDHAIIHISREDAGLDLGPELGVDHSLECSQRVGHPKEHDEGFEQPFGGEECSLPLISFFYPDIVVPPSDVEFSEKGTPS